MVQSRPTSHTGIEVPVGHMLHPAGRGQSQKLSQYKAMVSLHNCIALPQCWKVR